MDAPATVSGASHPGQLSMKATQAATRAPLSLFLPLSVLHLLVEIAFVIQHSNPRSGGDQEPSRRGRRRALSPSLRTWPISSKTLLPGNHNRPREAEAPVVRRLAQADFQKGYPFAQSFATYVLRAGLGQFTIPVCRPFVAAVVHPRPQRCLAGTFLGDRPVELQPRVPVRSPWCSLALPVTMFVLSGIESYAVLLGLLRSLHIVKGQQASEVIYKPC